MGEDWNVGHAVNNSGKLDISYACTLWQLEWIVMITMVFSEECKWGMHSNIQEEKLDRYITQKCNAIGCCWSWRIRKWSPALSSEWSEIYFLEFRDAIKLSCIARNWYAAYVLVHVHRFARKRYIVCHSSNRDEFSVPTENLLHCIASTIWDFDDKIKFTNTEGIHIVDAQFASTLDQSSGQYW